MKGMSGNTSGSVMLEVVMTLPLHLVMLLSTVWLGMMCVGHTYVAELDYANAMTLSNRDNSLAEPLETYRSLLYQDGSHASVTDEGSGAEGSTSWLRRTTSRVRLRQCVPGWLAGLDMAVKHCMHLGEPDTSVITADYSTVAMDMYAQGAAGNKDALAVNSEPTTTVLSRNGADYPVDRSLATDWSGVVHESYPDGHAPTRFTQKSVANYSRVARFSDWSGKH